MFKHLSKFCVMKRTLTSTPSLPLKRPLSQMTKAFTETSESQPVAESLTTAALFLTLTLENPVKAEKVKSVLSQVCQLTDGLHQKYENSGILCVVGIGHHGWTQLFGEKLPAPKGLHPFKELKGVHHAPSTPGDIFFHIRANEMSVCFELGAQISRHLDGAAKIVDEVHGFKFDDNRNLLGFVDGTGNPGTREEIIDATIIGQQEDADYINGSYVIIQKYLHDVKGWDELPVEMQQYIIGRTKDTDVSLKDKKKSWSHTALTEIVDEKGTQHEVLRDNMPFGTISKGDYGTFFIAYSKTPDVTEKMLDNMFIGNPEGNYDRILDYSRAVTGNLFFCPTKDFLKAAENF